MINEYKFTPTLPIREYNRIIKKCYDRIKSYKNMFPGKHRYYFIYREITLIRHCKIMIRYVQSQLN